MALHMIVSALCVITVLVPIACTADSVKLTTSSSRLLPRSSSGQHLKKQHVIKLLRQLAATKEATALSRPSSQDKKHHHHHHSYYYDYGEEEEGSYGASYGASSYDASYSYSYSGDGEATSEYAYYSYDDEYTVTDIDDIADVGAYNGDDGTGDDAGYVNAHTGDDSEGDSISISSGSISGSSSATCSGVTINSAASSARPQQSQQKIYASALQQDVLITGSGFTGGSIQQLQLQLQPASLVQDRDFTLEVVSATALALHLKSGKKWRSTPDGLLAVSGITVTKATNNNNNNSSSGSSEQCIGFAAVPVALVLPDPQVLPSQDPFHLTQSHLLVIYGSGFSSDDDDNPNLNSPLPQVILSPTAPGEYEVVAALQNALAILLRPGSSWLPAETLRQAQSEQLQSVDLRVVSIDTGAGRVTLQPPPTVAAVIPDIPDVHCIDSCASAYNGECEDPLLMQEAAVDDAYYYDDTGVSATTTSAATHRSLRHHHDDYASDYSYSYDSPAGIVGFCDPGTDCTDCGGPEALVDLYAAAYYYSSSGGGDSEEGAAAGGVDDLPFSADDDHSSGSDGSNSGSSNSNGVAAEDEELHGSQVSTALVITIVLSTLAGVTLALVIAAAVYFKCFRSAPLLEGTMPTSSSTDAAAAARTSRTAGAAGVAGAAVGGAIEMTLRRSADRSKKSDVESSAPLLKGAAEDEDEEENGNENRDKDRGELELFDIDAELAQLEFLKQQFSSTTEKLSSELSSSGSGSSETATAAMATAMKVAEAAEVAEAAAYGNYSDYSAYGAGGDEEEGGLEAAMFEDEEASGVAGKRSH